MICVPYTLPNSNLYHAALTGDLELAQKSVAQGADVNYQEINRTVLMEAVIAENMEVAEYLLNNGADPNKGTKVDLTPLIQAESGEMVKLLIAHGADLKIGDGKRFSAATYYMCHNCLDALKAWMELGLPKPRVTMKLLNQLLISSKFEMITLLTGFDFKTKHPLEKMAEFKGKYKHLKADKTKRGA